MSHYHCTLNAIAIISAFQKSRPPKDTPLPNIYAQWLHDVRIMANMLDDTWSNFDKAAFVRDCEQ